MADENDLDEAQLDALLAAGDVDAIKAVVSTAAVEQGQEPDPNAVAGESAAAAVEAGGQQSDAGDKPIEQELDKDKAAAEARDKESRREYIAHLPTLRQEEIRIAAANPDLPLEQVSELAKASIEKQSSSQQQEETSELETVSERIAEIQKELNDRDAKWQRGDDYEVLQAERDKLSDTLQALKIEKIIAERDAKLQQQSFDETWDFSEAAANKEFPDLTDPTSEMFAAVAGRNEQISALMESGRPFPVIELDGAKVTLDPNDPKFPMLVAREQAIKLGKKAPAAQPGAKEASHAVKPRVISGVPASSGNVSVRDKAAGDAEPDLKDRVIAVKDDADLDSVLSSALGWRPRRAAFN